MDSMAQQYIKIHRQKKLIERQTRLNRRLDLVSRVDNLLSSLQGLCDTNSDIIKAYINRTQVNLDFIDGSHKDKIYFCCSKSHDMIRVDFLIRSVSPSNNMQLFKVFGDHIQEPFSEYSGKKKRDSQLRLMLHSDDITAVVEKFLSTIRPNIAR